MARDTRIYGIDENAYAHRVSTEALGSPSPAPHTGSEPSKGASGNESVSEKGSPTVTDRGCGSDSRAHTAGNHGKQD